MPAEDAVPPSVGFAAELFGRHSHAAFEILAEERRIGEIEFVGDLLNGELVIGFEQIFRVILLHEHTIDIDSKQRDVDLQIVSEGAVKIEKLDQSPEITLTILTGFTGNDAVIYDYIPIKVDGETRNIPRYVQTLRIIAETNGQKQARDCRFRIITQNPMPECADITIRQAGAK